MKIFYIIILAFIFCVSCGDYKQLDEDNSFRISNGAEPETLDPGMITTVTDLRIVRDIFDGLTELNPKTLKPQPACATWEISKDAVNYTFTLKDNLKWSDNTSLTSEDFLYAWKRVLNRNVPAPYANFFYYIKNAEKYYNGEIKDFSEVGIKLLSDKKILITLEKPTPFFLELTSFPVYYPLKKECIEKYDRNWTLPENIVSNGAFTLTNWIPRQNIVLKKSENYHDKEKVKLDSVIYYPHDNLDTAYLRFLQGKIDWLPALPLEKLEEIKFNPNYYCHPYSGTYFFRYNCSRPPFDNNKIRQAFSMAVNRETITNEVLGNGEKPTGAFSPEYLNYQPVKGLQYNPQEARKLLKEAGYNDENKFPKVEIFYNTSDAHKKIAEALCAQLRENLGINVGLRNTEWKTFVPLQNDLQYDISRSSWIGDYNDPESFFSIFVSTNGNNRCGWKNAEYDELYAKVQTNISDEDRMKTFQRMEQILVVESAPIFPLYSYISQGLLAENIKGWSENTQDMHQSKFIIKE